jgi:hypothetical protein
MTGVGSPESVTAARYVDLRPRLGSAPEAESTPEHRFRSFSLAPEGGKKAAGLHSVAEMAFYRSKRVPRRSINRVSKIQ